MVAAVARQVDVVVDEEAFEVAVVDSEHQLDRRTLYKKWESSRIR